MPLQAFQEAVSVSILPQLQSLQIRRPHLQNWYFCCTPIELYSFFGCTTKQRIGPNVPQGFCFGGIFLPLFSWLIVPVVMPFQVFLEPQFGLLLECRCLNRHQGYA